MTSSTTTPIDVGHSDMITSIDTFNTILATSSYDQTIKLFDVENHQPIDSISPTIPSEASISAIKLSQNYLYAAIQNHIFMYDVRKTSQELFRLKCFENCQDENEMNCLDVVGENGCACDDNGNVHVFSTPVGTSDVKLKKTLSSHNNICMNAKFRPNTTSESRLLLD